MNATLPLTEHSFLKMSDQKDRNCAHCGKTEKEIRNDETGPCFYRFPTGESGIECQECHEVRRLAKIEKALSSVNPAEIDTDLNKAPVCPYCSSKYEFDCENPEYEQGTHKLECGECEKTFECETEASFHYSTSQI